MTMTNGTNSNRERNDLLGGLALDLPAPHHRRQGEEELIRRLRRTGALRTPPIRRHWWPSALAAATFALGFGLARVTNTPLASLEARVTAAANDPTRAATLELVQRSASAYVRAMEAVRRSGPGAEGSVQGLDDSIIGVIEASRFFLSTTSLGLACSAPPGPGDAVLGTL